MEKQQKAKQAQKPNDTGSWKKVGFVLLSALTIGALAYKSGAVQQVKDAAQDVAAGMAKEAASEAAQAKAASDAAAQAKAMAEAMANWKTLCPAHKPLAPPGFEQSELDYILKNEEYKQHAIKRFQGAIQIPTECFDDMGPVNEEPRFEIFYKFADYLKEAFPLVHSNLKLDKVNTHGLVYTWEGSNPSLKPQMFMAHQDVVPVNNETADQWSYPPFSGHFDGKDIWGRGSVDTKNSLIGSLAAAELLLEQGYSPERTHIFSYGFDEEISGPQGATNISKHLLEKYGKNGIFSIVDEGPGILETKDYSMILIATGEKGYLDIEVTVNVAGGHSSMPPKHTGIGLASLMIAEIERTPHDNILTPENPFFYTWQCIADHDTSLSDMVRMMIRRAGTDKVANQKLVAYLAQNPLYRSLIRTSQAVDLINGGVKSNALPETTTFVINHRIDMEASVTGVKEKIIGNVLTIAKENDLTVTAFGKVVNEGKSGSVDLHLFKKALEVAPKAPTTGPSWDIMSGTALHVYGKGVYPEGHNLFAAPGIMTANTDTRHFWPLTESIYRFNAIRMNAVHGIHTVDEHLEFDCHLETIAFYHQFIKNSAHFN